MRKRTVFTLLTLAAVSTLGAAAEVRPSTASTSSVVTATPGLPSRTWVESYPALLRYAGIPVLVPARGSMTRINTLTSSPSTSDTLPGTVVDASRDGYQVTLASTSLPPWSTQEPKFLGNRTTFSFAGAKATPSPATWLWLGLAPNTDFDHLPGLPVALSDGVTGYLTYFRNITGNGGSSTTLTWKAGAYMYQVSVPIAAGSGGRTAALTLARDMTPLTVHGLQDVIAKPFHVLGASEGQKSPAYRDTVKLAPDLSSLPKSLDETLPVADGAMYPPYESGVHEGTGRGYRWRYRMTPTQTPTLIPTYSLSGVRVSGQAHAGGVVHVSGVISPKPPVGLQLAITWPLRSGPGQVHTFPPTQPLPWWGTLDNVSFDSLSDVHITGNHFTASLPIPLALYDQGLGATETNRWLILKPGIYHPQLMVNSGQGNGVTLALRVWPGTKPVAPGYQAGPYLSDGQDLPPVAANNLAYYGLGSGTQPTSVPLLLPAWVPGATDPYSVSHQFPLTSVQTIPGGYAAIQFHEGINERGGPSPKPWPADLPQAALAIYGVQGAPSPYADQIAHVSGHFVAIGPYAGHMYRLPSGTLVTAMIDGTDYGVWAAHPATASDTLATARSLTELNAGSPADPANAVLLYASLLHSSQRGNQPGWADAYSQLWSRNQAHPHRTPGERRLDSMLSLWNGMQVRILSIQGPVVTVEFSGVPAETNVGAHFTARIRVGQSGDLHLLTASALMYTQTAKQFFGPALTPVKPLAISFGMTNKTPLAESRVPVVLVPFTAGVEMSKPADVPKTVWAPVPTDVADRMAAYLYPVNSGEWVYLLAPRGMTGSALVATDGSAGLDLTNHDASITFSHAGGSMPMAQSAAAPYFPAAGMALDHQGGQSGEGWKKAHAYLVQHAALQYQDDHRVALLAYENPGGRSVYGYSFYQPSYLGAFGLGAQLNLVTDAADASLAPYVMQSALTTLTQVGEPQLSGQTLGMRTAGVRLGGNSHILPVPDEFATSDGLARATAHGIAWLGEPTMINTDPQAKATWQVRNAMIPTQVYAINLSPANHKDLASGSYHTLTLVAPYELGAGTNQAWYTTVRLDGSAGPNWLIYQTTYSAPGMNQPAGNDLYALNLDSGNPQPVLLTPYLDAGGYFFSYGSDGSYVIYDEANDLNPQGKLLQDAEMVNLATGVRIHLAVTAIHEGVATVRIAGRLVHVMLQHD